MNACTGAPMYYDANVRRLVYAIGSVNGRDARSTSAGAIIMTEQQK